MPEYYVIKELSILQNYYFIELNTVIKRVAITDEKKERNRVMIYR